MIFVTIGSMFPLDRLIRVMDDWAKATGRDDVFAQIGNGSYVPQTMQYTRRLSQVEFGTTVAQADLTRAVRIPSVAPSEFTDRIRATILGFDT